MVLYPARGGDLMINDLQEFYDNVTNPLDDNYTLEKLMESYARSTNQNIFNFKCRTMLFSAEGFNFDDGVTYLFNHWKNTITSMYSEDIKKLFGGNEIDEDFLKLKKYLHTVKDAENFNQVREKYRQMQTIMPKSMKKYGGFSRSDDCSKYKFSSNFIIPTNSYILNHKFHLNLDKKDITKFIKLFIEVCEKINIPYTFTVPDHHNYFYNGLHIYSDNKHLLDYYYIISTILKKNPDIKKSAGHPEVAYGTIDQVIGYSYGDSASLLYNSSYNVIHNFYEPLVSKYPNTPVSYNGKEQTLIDAITFTIIHNKDIDVLLEDMYTVFNSQDLNEEELSILRQRLQNHILKSISKGNFNYEDLVISFSKTGDDNRSLCYSGDDIQRGISSLLPNFLASIPAFIKEDSIDNVIKKQIANNFIKSKYDATKMCFSKFFNQNTLMINEQRRKSIDDAIDEVISKNNETINPEETETFHNRQKNDEVINKFSFNQPLRISGPVYQPTLLIEDKSLKNTSTENSNSTDPFISSPYFYHYTKDEIIQDLAINSQEEQFFATVGMSDDEITASQEKINSVKVKTHKRH